MIKIVIGTGNPAFEGEGKNEEVVGIEVSGSNFDDGSVNNYSQGKGVEDSYTVDSQKDWVTITRVSDNATLFMQGDDATNFLNNENLIEDVKFRNYAISQYDELFELPKAVEVPKAIEVPDKSLYSALKEAGVKIDNHESDLYVPVTPETTKIIDQYSLLKSNSTVFKSAIDGALTYDIPFAFEPFWEKKSLQAAQNIASQKEGLTVADPSLCTKYDGKVMGVTDHHIVISLGRSALIVGKRDVDRVPIVDESVNLKFAGGKGVLEPVKKVNIER